RAQNLGDRLGPPRARLDGRIVRDYDRGPSFDLTETGHDTGGRGLFLVAIVRDQQPDLEEIRAGVEQRVNALARRHLARAMLPRGAIRAAAFLQTYFELTKLLDLSFDVRFAREVHDYLILEKSAGSMKTEVGGLARIFPSFSDSAETFFHSSSARN